MLCSLSLILGLSALLLSAVSFFPHRNLHVEVEEPPISNTRPRMIPHMEIQFSQIYVLKVLLCPLNFPFVPLIHYPRSAKKDPKNNVRSMSDELNENRSPINSSLHGFLVW